MSYNNNTVLNSVIEILLIKISTIQASPLYKVPYRKILHVTIALESIQEQRFTPLVESDNQQQIYRWVRKYLLLPSGKWDYTDWYIHQSIEVITLLKSICTAIHGNFGVTNTSLQRYLNVISPPLKCSSLKHLWYLISLGKIGNTTVRKTIRKNIVKTNRA